MSGPQPASLVAGRYRLERLIGRGGMAEVWLAQDERLGRPVGVKLLASGYSSMTDFEREAGILSRLQHPNIVTVYDAGEEDGRNFIVMEFVEGRSLRQHLQEQGPLSPAAATELGAGMAEALAYAHGHGVLHNDVKPENILLDTDGQARLTDFGVAEITGATLDPERAHQVLGTLAYVAPEVLQGSPPDGRADVYALATTIFEAVSGRLPFEAASQAAIAGRKLNEPAPRLSSILPGAYGALEDILAGGLAPHPGSRPDASSFAKSLAEAARGTAALRPGLVGAAPARARVTQPLVRVRPPGRSGRGFALALAGLGAVGILGAGALAFSWRDREPGPTHESTTPLDAAAATSPTTASTPPPTSTPPQAKVTPTRPPPKATATPTKKPSNDNRGNDDKKDKPGRGR
jgi:serine/threonine-protein kinase